MGRECNMSGSMCGQKTWTVDYILITNFCALIIIFFIKY